MFPRLWRQWIGLCLAPAALAAGGDWITEPSYFTHDHSGQRVQQYQPIGPFYRTHTPDFQRSGYHHTRSSLQVGSSVDHFHQVEEWGRAVRPYDEWRFPYRPYSVPYDAWGAPFAGLGFGRPGLFPGYGYGFGAGGFSGGGFPGGFPGGLPGAGTPYLPNGPSRVPLPYPGYRPWFDDRYPAFDDRAPFRQQPFPQLPGGP
jgi:hypothetical protein